MSNVVGQGRPFEMCPADAEDVEFDPARHGGKGQVRPDVMSRGQGSSPLGPDQLRAIVETVPAAIYATDADGRITFYNEAAAALWGYRPEVGKSEYCGSWKLYRADGTPLPHDECPMAMTLRHGQAVRGMEAIAERPDGSRVPFMSYPTPLFDEAGQLVGAVNLLVETSDRRQAEQAGRRLASIVESSDDAIVSKDFNGIITSWNGGAERLFGYCPEEVLGKPITILMPEDRLAEEPGILERIRRGERIDHYETVRRRKDGSLVDISLTVSPVRDGAGRIIGASKIARDITDRRRAEQTKDLLLREMQHRMKNTLAMVQSFANQTLHGATGEELAAFSARLRALAGAHDLLTSHDWNRARVGEIVRRALEPFQETHADRVTLEGSCAVFLDSGRALLLTLALHELATNAVKYGALSNDDGRVEVAWDVTDARLQLQWRESGGPPVVAPTRKGFGSRLIEGALNGQQDRTHFEFAQTGVSCTIELQL